MKLHLIAVRGRRLMAATKLGFQMVCLAMVLGVLSPWLTALAADEEGFVVLPDRRTRFSGPIGREGDIGEILATRERTGGAFGVFLIEIASKSGPPAHIHRGEDEFFYVLKGEFHFKLGERIVSAPPGSFVFAPREKVHTFQNIGPEPGLLLISVTPAGLEKLFEERQGVDAETQKALFKKYRLDIVGPPLGR